MSERHLKVVGAALGFNWLPIFVALEHGLFKKAGLEIELERLGGVEKATKAIVDGDAAFAITPPEGAVSNYVNGGELRIVASNASRLPMSLVARPEIKSIDDLRGKKIGTSSLTEGTAIYTQIMLAENGLKYPGDYEFALAGIHTARWEAMLKGEIDAAPQPAPWNFLAKDQGYSLLGEVDDFIPEIVFAAFVGSQTWLQANRDIVVALLKALGEAYAFVNDHGNEAESIRLFQEITTKDSPSLARRGFIYMRDMGMWPDGMAVSPRALGATVDLMIRSDLLDESKREAAKGVFDPSFLKEALS